MTLSFPPPKNWQDFETITKDVARFKLEGDFENYGRLGQAQGGIDVYGWDKKSQNTGLQCKHKTVAPSSSEDIVTEISIDIIDKELKLADKFTPKLTNFIIATTSFRDTKIQQHVFGINEKRKAGALPYVILWNWENYEEELNKHAELGYVYYENMLKASNKYDKDAHILSLLKHSLDRPAFNTLFDAENHCGHFIQAISDTQRAFTTGQLYDRDGNLLASSYPAKKLSDKVERDLIYEAQLLLNEIRTFVTQQTKDGNIIQQDNFLEFRHNWELKISDFLNDKRKSVIHLVNKLLVRHGLEEIKSSLIK